MTGKDDRTWFLSPFHPLLYFAGRARTFFRSYNEEGGETTCNNKEEKKMLRKFFKKRELKKQILAVMDEIAEAKATMENMLPEHKHYAQELIFMLNGRKAKLEDEYILL